MPYSIRLQNMNVVIFLRKNMSFIKQKGKTCKHINKCKNYKKQIPWLYHGWKDERDWYKNNERD